MLFSAKVWRTEVLNTAPKYIRVNLTLFVDHFSIGTTLTVLVVVLLRHIFSNASQSSVGARGSGLEPQTLLCWDSSLSADSSKRNRHHENQKKLENLSTKHSSMQRT